MNQILYPSNPQLLKLNTKLWNSVLKGIVLKISKDHNYIAVLHMEKVTHNYNLEARLERSLVFCFNTIEFNHSAHP